MKTDRDAALERLLRDPSRMRDTDPGAGQCLDAETIAAWAEGTLGRRERDAAEAHVSDCARCQAVLAVMVKSAPASSATSWWRLPSVWLLPLSAAAAAAIVWAIVPGRSATESTGRSASAVQQIAPVSVAPAAVASAPPSAAAEPETKLKEAPARQRPAASLSRRLDAPAPAPVSASASAPPIAQPRPPEEKREALANQAMDRLEAASKPAASPAPPAPPPSAPQLALPAAAKTAPATEAVGAAAPSPLGARAPAAARAMSVVATRDTTAVIQSPDVRTSWRIVPGGSVQRSTDGGATWQTQPTGVNVTLTAGHAPSVSVCWLVGPNGLVLRSIDGRTWTRVPFPDTIGLTSVRATDEKTATVTASDGRVFATIDGGQIWSRPPGN